jgi:carboxyl-terminal processing protease
VSFAASDVAVERVRDDVTLVRVGAFTRGVGRQLREVLRTDRPTYAGGVLLDLRGNPGGLLAEAVEVASAFLDGGPVVSYDRRGQTRRTLEALGRGDTVTPLVVLIDPGTASAAEVVAAALQDRGRAVLVGSRSYGKGTVQEPTRLSDGSTIELTVGRYLTPAGRSLDRLGVAPDVLVPDDAGRDVAERRAVEVLAGLVAALPPSGQG